MSASAVAIVYVRQSSPGQLIHNQESNIRQYALVDRAHDLGFKDAVVIDDDLGRTGQARWRGQDSSGWSGRCAQAKPERFSALRHRGSPATAVAGIIISLSMRHSARVSRRWPANFRACGKTPRRPTAKGNEWFACCWKVSPCLKARRSRYMFGSRVEY